MTRPQPDADAGTNLVPSVAADPTPRERDAKRTPETKPTASPVGAIGNFGTRRRSIRPRNEATGRRFRGSGPYGRPVRRLAKRSHATVQPSELDRARGDCHDETNPRRVETGRILESCRLGGFGGIAEMSRVDPVLIRRSPRPASPRPSRETNPRTRSRSLSPRLKG